MVDVPKQYNKSEIIKFIDDAIAQWTRNLNLHIARSKTDSGDINIRFSRQDGRSNILGYALAPINGDIYLDEEEDWTFEKKNSDSKIYFAWVIAHELGHSLGIGHNPNNDSIMYPYYSQKVFKPSHLDYNNLKYLYGLKPNKTEICNYPKIDGIVPIPKNRFLIFKKHQMWILSSNGIEEGPFEISSYFTDLPSPIDCAFLKDNITYIFRNQFYYKFYNNKDKIKQKYISKTFPNLPLNLSAAFYEPNQKTIYFFKNDIFYEFNTTKPVGQRLSAAKRISESWNGIPDDVEAATLLDNKIVLFVKRFQCYFYNLSTKTLKSRPNYCKKYFKCKNKFINEQFLK